MGRTPTESHSEDAALVARVQKGDRAAFRRLFDAYSPRVYRIAYRMLGDAEDAADLAQDVFVRAYERIHSLRDGQAFHAWIIRLAANMACDRARRRRRPALSLDAPPPGAEEGTEWSLSDRGRLPETQAISAELAARVQSALAALSPERRAVVVLHHMEGRPVEDIAAMLRIPVGTVKSRLSRARAELKRRLEGYLEA